MVGPYVESCTVVVASGEFDVLEVARGRIKGEKNTKPLGLENKRREKKERIRKKENNRRN